MNASYNKIDFMQDENKIEYQSIKEDKKIYFNICLHSEKFKEYQKNLFNDFYSKVLELFENNTVFLDFKKALESEIKQFNTQLKVFQEKINNEEKIEIRWTFQIIWQETYVAWLIWESSLVIFRDEKLESVIVNEVEEDDKIDIFWEIIEWDLENKDKIISICSNIYNYLADDEIKETINTHDVLKTLEDILTTRVEKKEIWKIEELNINIEKIKVEDKPKLDINKYKNILKNNRYTVWTIIAISIIFFVIFSIFSYLGKNEKQIIEVWGKQIEANIDELKRKIDAFWKLESTDTQDAKQQYKEILAELDMYDENNIQTLEVKELRKKIEQEYYRWFNINLVSKWDGLLQNIYNISKEEIEQLSWVKSIIKSSSRINIIWNKWALLWTINDQYKWTIQEIWLPTTIKTCSNNLAWNWVYCVMNNNDIYNISKTWISSLTNSKWEWPNNISSIDIYGSNKMYLLTNDEELNSNGTYISRYVLNGTNNFASPTNYVFTDDTQSSLTSMITSWSNMNIDWTFIISSSQWVLQAYRNDNFTNNVKLRQISWWDKAIIDDENDFSWKVKVISNLNSNYIHLFDFATQSLVTYLTSPYKTNSTYTNSYKLIYKYKTRFMFDWENIQDVIVDHNTTTQKKTAYILTNKWVYNLSLEQFWN